MQALGWTVFGLDADARAVEACRARGVRAQRGTLDAASLPAESVDCLTARHVIEHVADPVAFAAAAARLLRAGGLLQLRTPNAEALGRERFGAAWFANDVPRHLVLFTPSSLDALLTRHGFERVALRTRSTPKVLLNSVDYRDGRGGRPRRYSRGARLAARPEVWLSLLAGRGYEIVAEYRKR